MDNEQSTQTVSAPAAPQQTAQNVPQKFCKYCGQSILMDAVMCTHCGRMVEELPKQQAAQPNIVITNTNTNSNVNTISAGALKKEKNKWISLLLCLFLGYIGAHKFYEGKIGMGILYLFTVGLFGIGLVIDFIVLLFKPNPYYV